MGASRVWERWCIFSTWEASPSRKLRGSPRSFPARDCSSPAMMRCCNQSLLLDDQALKECFCREVLPLERALSAFIRRNWRDAADVVDLRQDIYMPVMTLSVGANWFVVVECVQNLAFSPRGGPFLLAYGAVHGESDKDFSHSISLWNT